MATLQFRVLFDSAKEEKIFRDIKISDQATFEQFYTIILDSYGLTNDQMASFFVSDLEWSKGEEISLLDMAYEQHEEEQTSQMNKIQLKNRVFDLQQRYILVYDFLSMWIFLIELLEANDKEIEQPEICFSIGEIPKDVIEKKENQSIYEEEMLEEEEEAFNPLNGFDDEDDYYDEFSDFTDDEDY